MYSDTLDQGKNANVRSVVQSKMVKEIEGKYICEECKLSYKDKSWAEKCEAWCKEHHRCNIEITSHAENKGEMKNGFI